MLFPVMLSASPCFNSSFFGFNEISRIKLVNSKVESSQVNTNTHPGLFNSIQHVTRNEVMPAACVSRKSFFRKVNHYPLVTGEGGMPSPLWDLRLAGGGGDGLTVGRELLYSLYPLFIVEKNLLYKADEAINLSTVDYPGFLAAQYKFHSPQLSEASTSETDLYRHIMGNHLKSFSSGGWDISVGLLELVISVFNADDNWWIVVIVVNVFKGRLAAFLRALKAVAGSIFEFVLLYCDNNESILSSGQGRREMAYDVVCGLIVRGRIFDAVLGCTINYVGSRGFEWFLSRGDLTVRRVFANSCAAGAAEGYMWWSATLTSLDTPNSPILHCYVHGAQPQAADQMNLSRDDVGLTIDRPWSDVILPRHVGWKFDGGSHVAPRCAGSCHGFRKWVTIEFIVIPEISDYMQKSRSH
eukprot:gene4355-8666_t